MKDEPGLSGMADLLARANAVLPAGGFGNFDPSIVIREGRGGRVWDENGDEYVDFLIGSGPMLIGHGHPEVLDAVRSQLDKGLTFFASNAAGIALAEAICEAVPCADKVRFVSSGSEADMYAMRLARAHTGKDKILKFEGGYHGMCDEALMSMAPHRRENFPQALPDTAGTAAHARDGVFVAPYNDLAFAEALIAEHADELAAIIVEPLQRIVPPAPGFLEGLRAAATKHGVLLIFDEIVTGFRLAYGGAQELYGVTPDLCTLGKIVGGGFPLAAIAGRAEIMTLFDLAAAGREGFVFQVGTLSGNPVAAVAGLKTMEILRRPGAYDALRATGRQIMDALHARLTAAGAPVQIVGDPVLFDVVFSPNPVRDYRSFTDGDSALMTVFNTAMRAHGVLKAPNKFYTCLAHTAEDVAHTVTAIDRAAEAVAATL